MTTPRRRILRNSNIRAEHDPRQVVALERSAARLIKERDAFRRWLSRLKRAMRAVDKHLRSVDRLEKSLALLRRS